VVAEDICKETEEKLKSVLVVEYWRFAVKNEVAGFNENETDGIIATTEEAAAAAGRAERRNTDAVTDRRPATSSAERETLFERSIKYLMTSTRLKLHLID